MSGFGVRLNNMDLIKVTQADFDEKVSKSKLPVLLDFYADWCTPCKMADPVLDELSKEHKDKLSIMKVNVDENQEIAMKYHVMSIPTTIMFNNGQEVDRQTGFAGKQAFEELIKKVLQK